MRWTMWAAAAAVLVVGGSVGSSTSAHSAGIRKHESRAHAYRHAQYAPRARGHYYRSSGYTTCGEFRYWKGGRCLDARTSPPNVSGPRK
jgi:hypothetical protein